MKFTVQPGDLKSAFAAVKMALSSKNSMPVLDNIKIEPTESETTIKLTASDGDNTIVASMAVEDTEGLCPALVPAEFLGAFVSGALNEWPVTFDFADNGRLTVSDLVGEFEVICPGNVEEYPLMPSVADASVLTLSASAFLDSSTLAIGYTGNDTLRPIMAGVNYDISGDELRVGASDTKRLFYDVIRGVGSQENVSFTMPKKSVQSIVTLFGGSDEIKISVNQKMCGVERDGMQIMCRLLEGKFPRILSVIPKNKDRVAMVDRGKLSAAIRRVLIASDPATQQIIITYDGVRSMKIETESADIGRAAQVNCDTVSQTNIDNGMKISFRGNFLLDVLASLKGSQNVAIMMSEPSRASLIKSKPEDERLMLLMPMLIGK